VHLLRRGKYFGRAGIRTPNRPARSLVPILPTLFLLVLAVFYEGNVQEVCVIIYLNSPWRVPIYFTDLPEIEG
jgi:hypothetical protein